jgi:hypothetical protein
MSDHVCVHDQAANLFYTIDSMGDRNGSLELFEIILYMQEHYQHLFCYKDVDSQEVGKWT